MKTEILDEWKAAAEAKGYQLKQIQGFDQWEAYKDGVLVGHFSSHSGTLDDEHEPNPSDPVTGEPLLTTEEKLT